MNQRVKELMTQAGFVGENMYPVFGTSQQTALQNFAEMIVKECIQVARNADNKDEVYAWYAIQNHFGIEG